MKRVPWIPIVGYIAIIGLVFGTVLFPHQGFLIFGDDIHRQYYYYRQFFNSFLNEGIFPWWNPYLFGGEPFIANPIVNIWYPLNWLFVFLPLNVAYSWHIAFHILWAMVGMYILLRNLSSPRRRGSSVGEIDSRFRGNDNMELGPWVGGLIFGLSGFFMARVWAGHVDVIAAASWMPWVVWAFWQGRIVLAATVFALQLYAGYQTMAFFTVEVVAVALFVQAVSSRSIRPISRAVGAGLLGIGLAALQLLPEQEFFRRSIRTFPLPYQWISYGVLTWQSLRQLVSPFIFGDPVTYHGPPPNFIEHSMFVGVVGLILAMGGLTRLPWSFSLIILFGLWVSLGSNAPFDLQKLLWQIIPMYRYLRIPPRHLILVVFGLSGLAGIGLSCIKNRTVQLMISVVVVVEMVLFGRNFITLRAVPETRHDRSLIGLLTKDAQPYRVLQNFGVWLPQRDVLDFDSALSYGIYSSTGYDPSIVRAYYEVIAEASGKSGAEAVLLHDVQVPYLTPAAADMIDFLNIKYIMVPRAYDPFIGNGRYALLREDAEKDFRVYENTTVKPRFFLANPVCGSIDLTSFTPNTVTLTADVICDTQLESSEVWYPGWHATVDGKEVPIQKLYNTFRTLFIPTGKHTIVYVYKPTIFYVAGSVSFIIVCVLLFWVRKHR